MKKHLLLILAIAVGLCAGAQNVRVLPAENLYMEKGQLHRGVIFGELVPEASANCYLRYRDIDSVDVYISLYDPKTMEEIPFAAVYAVHRDKDYVVDSMLAMPDTFWLYYINVTIPLREPRLLAVHLPGYVPLIMEYEPPVVPEITKVSRDEYEALDSGYRQTFQPEPFPADEYKRWVEAVVLDEQEKTWFESGDLWLEAGRFMPMGLPAVRVVAPIDDQRRFHLNNMLYGIPIHADFAYALSPEGYFVGQVQRGGDLRVVWTIARIDGYEQHELSPIVFDTPPGNADEFRWAPGGWLYFKRGGECFKLHVDIHVTQNCRMQDIEVTEAEFFDVLQRSEQQENMIHGDRSPDAADTAILRRWARDVFLDPDFIMEESGYVWYEPGYECLEIAIGDFCCTRLKGDTVDMQACMMALSAAVPRFFAGVNMEWGTGETEVPAYIYFYPLLPALPLNQGEYPNGGRGSEHVGKPYIYQTTPAWYPTGRHYFWAADGWFYIEGYDRKNEKNVYHKLHLP